MVGQRPSPGEETQVPVPSPPPPPLDRASQPSPLGFDALFHAYHDFVWRSLRRLGLKPEDADDAAQEVFLVAQRRLAEIVAGRERAFLFGTAMRVVSGRRRTLARRRDQPGDGELAELADPAGDPAAELDRKRGRELLDGILDRMPIELRAVFVLFELEQLTMAEIASDLDLPAGTVASRLRRARELFAAACARVQARDPARRDPAGHEGQER
jgi:RNA polymerase sigma-70 factor, ECF subfamily